MARGLLLYNCRLIITRKAESGPDKNWEGPGKTNINSGKQLHLNGEKMDKPGSPLIWSKPVHLVFLKKGLFPLIPN